MAQNTMYYKIRHSCEIPITAKFVNCKKKYGGMNFKKVAQKKNSAARISENFYVSKNGRRASTGFQSGI